MKILSYRNLTFLIVISLFAFWIWAFSPWVKRGHPDRLDEEGFALSAVTFCDEVFPDGKWDKGTQQVSTPEERVILLDESNMELDRLVSGLRSLWSEHQLTARDRTLLNEWLKDWEYYLEDRIEWGRLLRTGEDAPLNIRGRDGVRTTDRINNFSSLNKMRACNIPDFI